MIRDPGNGVRVSWSTLPGKPSTFAPAAHTHAWGDITDKPTAYPPTAHGHVWADITDRPTIPAATPLGSAAPQALGTAAPGSSGNAAREDHVHPLPSGRWEFLRATSVGETGLLMLNIATKRYTVAVPGVVPADRIGVALNGTPQNGIVQDAYVSAAGVVSIGLLLPALGIASTVAVPVAVYRIT